MHPQTRPDRPRVSVALTGACIALLAVAPLTAPADPPTAPAPHTLESRVSLADLDLSTPEGARAAHKRLRKMAESLCRRLWDSTSATFRWTYAACVKETFANAIQQLSAPALASTDRARAEP
jgi:UrcA family protein